MTNLAATMSSQTILTINHFPYININVSLVSRFIYVSHNLYLFRCGKLQCVVYTLLFILALICNPVTDMLSAIIHNWQSVRTLLLEGEITKCGNCWLCWDGGPHTHLHWYHITCDVFAIKIFKRARLRYCNLVWSETKFWWSINLKPV